MVIFYWWYFLGEKGKYRLFLILAGRIGEIVMETVENKRIDNKLEIELNKLRHYYKDIEDKPRYVENTPQEWEKFRLELERQLLNKNDAHSSNNKITTKECAKIVVSTAINEDTRDSENNIFNLQYFFLCADRVHFDDPNIDMVLIVKCVSNHDVYRARIYLHIQAKFRKHVQVAIKHIGRTITKLEKELPCFKECEGYVFPELETKEIGKNIGRMLPLINVSMTNDGESISYMDLVETTTDWLVKRDRAAGEGVLYLNAASGDNDISWGESQKEILDNLMYSNLTVLREKGGDFKSYIGDIENKIEGMSFLAQLIWIYELRYIYEQNDLKKIAADYWGDMEMVWEYTRWNAVAYAEGLLQLLENSCQHSCGKTGYFSVRVYDVNMNTTNANVLKVAERRERIYRRFRINISDQPLDVEDKSYLEFSVIDDAWDIKEHKACGVAEKAGATLDELFWEQGKSKEDIIHHYGLALFCSNIILNNGRFLFKSPAETEEQSCFAAFVKGDNAKASFKKTHKIESSWEPGLYTHYRILVPMISSSTSKFESLVDSRKKFEIGMAKSLFDDTKIGDRPTEVIPVNISGTIFFPKEETAFREVLKHCSNSQNDKIEYVKKIESLLQDILSQASAGVVKIDIRGYNRNQIELFAKGLFSFFEKDFSEIYILLYFDSDKSIGEFMRISSVFYNKFGEQSWVIDKQIALCSDDDITQCPAVKTVLAGENIDMVNETARTYMYYNPDVSQSLIAQLKYLTRKLNTKYKCETAPLYPFDLVQYDAEKKNWFLQRMFKILEKDLRENNMGCKLSNAHVCLGSRIHIRDFYEAELLFHNVGNVYRFAYCISEKIVKDIRIEDIKNRQLILIGYENYSVLLVSEIVRILKNYYGATAKEIEYITFVRNKRGKEDIVFSAELERKHEQKNEKEQRELLEANYISILPIGSTMSTIYKLINVTSRDLYGRFEDKNEKGQRLNFLRHYAVIVVAGRSNDKERLQDKYWKEELGTNSLILREEKNTKESIETKVEFFLKTETDWYLPEKCPMCGLKPESSERMIAYPLGHVDKTSTIPKLIYPAYESNFRGISFSRKEIEENNLLKLRELYGCISYGHISFLNNHFQFFVNFPKFYENCRAHLHDQLEKWFQTQRIQLERYAFNIVVSPLSELEPNFLKELIDNVFQHNIRFLYIPLNKAFKENVRTKFRYFAEEYKKVRKYNPQMHINVYYVDYSIVSAHTLYRGRNLINMLMEESGVDVKKNVNVYRKVFVLLNRSSFDTVNSFVENPDEDFCAYATLAVSSFNTWESSCPICEKVELYANLARSSATNELYWHYKRLEEKHSVRTPMEYSEWQKNRIFLDAGYYRKMMQCLQDAKLIKGGVGNPGKRKDESISLAEWLQDQYDLSEYESFYQMIDGEVSEPLLLQKYAIAEKIPAEARQKAVRFVQRKVIDVKNYLRLICTHKVMELQEGFYKDIFNKREKNPQEEYQKIIQERLIEFLRKELQITNGDSTNVSIIVKRELLISYLKVMSRGYLAYLAPVRETVYRIMDELLDKILEEWQSFSGKKQDIKIKDDEGSRYNLIRDYFSELLTVPTEKDDYWQIYQLTLTLMKRLSDLQSVKILDYTFFKKWLSFVGNLWDKYEAAHEVKDTENDNKNMVMEKALIDYTQCLKWSTAASEDSGKGILLKELCSEIRAGENDEKRND